MSMDLVLRTTLEHFCHGATSGDPRLQRPTELTKWRGTRSRKDTDLPCHLFLAESLVAKGSSPQCNVFYPSGYFSLGCGAEVTEKEMQKKQNQKKQQNPNNKKNNQAPPPPTKKPTQTNPRQKHPTKPQKCKRKNQRGMTF